MKMFFLPINSSHSIQGYDYLSRMVYHQQRKIMSMKLTGRNGCLSGGNPPYQLLCIVEICPCCLSKTVGRRSDRFYMNFPKKTLFLHRHLFKLDTINNFQNIRKLLKSTRSARKVSLGMLHCFLRSARPCAYCK